MNVVKFNDVADKIISVRGQKVLLDSDVAELYGTDTRDINKSVKNNPLKFPEGYIITLTETEKAKVVENFHHLEKLKFSPFLPNEVFKYISGIIKGKNQKPIIVNGVADHVHVFVGHIPSGLICKTLQKSTLDSYCINTYTFKENKF